MKGKLLNKALKVKVIKASAMEVFLRRQQKFGTAHWRLLTLGLRQCGARQKFSKLNLAIMHCSEH